VKKTLFTFFSQKKFFFNYYINIFAQR